MASQIRRGTVFRVEFPDLPGLTEQPRTITLHQSMGAHDVMALQYRGISQAYFTRLKTGVPVKVTWATAKARGEFIGYVSDTSPYFAAQGQQPLTVTCLGASFRLKERATNTWHGKTATAVAAEIAKKHKMKIVTADHRTKFPQLSQAGHSYWEFLNELGSRIGYAVRVEGVTLYFLPIDKMIEQHTSTIPELSFEAEHLPYDAQYEDRTLDRFVPLTGDHIEVGASNTTKVVAGVDPYTAKTFSAKASPQAKKALRNTPTTPLFTEYHHDSVAPTRAMAADLAKAKAEHARMSIPARAEAQGHPHIAPYHTVEISGVGETHDGYWIVKSSVHTMLWDGRYHCEIELGTDGTRNNRRVSGRPQTTRGTYPTVDPKRAATRPATGRLKRTVPIINERNTGYTVTPSRWTA